MKYIVRNRNSVENIYIYSKKSLCFLYNTIIGRIILKLLISKFSCNIVASYMNSRLSIPRIKKFIKKNDIEMTIYENNKYKSYNDFFTRKIIDVKRPIVSNKDVLICPCDSSLNAYRINKDLTLHIKGSYYSIDTLIDENIINEYIDGYALVFTLSEYNYHRYCYIDSGYHDKNNIIKGVFHTVQPISLSRYNFYKTNTRSYTLLHTDNFNDIVYVEIGAINIGRITNLYENYKFKKGEEKGYFEFGGSTIVVLIKKDIIQLDEDIIRNSIDEIGTLVKYGERIGKTK